jgi:site-specific DNA recombinase
LDLLPHGLKIALHSINTECLGRDGYRHLKGSVCDNKPMPQEQLDAVVWQEIMRLLEDLSLLQAELDRRLHSAQTTDP